MLVIEIFKIFTKLLTHLNMKKYILVLSGVMSLVVLMAFTGGGVNDAYNTGGAPSGHAGDPAAGGQTCRSCHVGPSLPPLTGILTSNIPPGGYTPNTTYTITATFVRPGHSRFGFSVSPQNPSGTLMGTLSALSGTQLNGGGKYVTHVAASTTGSGSKTWNFSWTAPPSGSGNVTFYGAFNATNNNGQASGDSTFLTTLTVSENTTGFSEPYVHIASATVYPNPASEVVNVKLLLSEQSQTKIELFDVNGKKLAVLTDENFDAGEITRSFSVAQYNKGVYFLYISAGRSSVLKRIMKL